MRDRLHGMIRRFTPAAVPAADQGMTDPALLESLRSLGYVAISAGNVIGTTSQLLPDPRDRIQVYELVSAVPEAGS